MERDGLQRRARRTASFEDPFVIHVGESFPERRRGRKGSALLAGGGGATLFAMALLLTRGGGPSHGKGGAFAFVLTEREEECSVRVGILSLQRTGVKEPIFLMTTLDSVEGMRGVEVRRVPVPPTLGKGKKRESFASLWAGRLPFERVVLFGGKVLFHRSPSFLFHVDPGKGIAAPEAYWMKGKGGHHPIGSEGPLVLRPRRDLFEDVLDSSLLTGVYESEGEYIDDVHGGSARILPQHVSVRIDEFVPNSTRFRRRGGSPHTYLLVRFVEEWAPERWTREDVEAAFPLRSSLADEFGAWRLLREEACPEGGGGPSLL